MELLVERAQRGDQFAFARLVRDYHPALRWWSREFFPPPGLSDDDMEQEALFGFWKAVRDFRSGNGSSFRSFAQLCVNRQLVTAVKAAKRLKHGPMNDAVSFEMPTADGRAELGDLVPAKRGDPVGVLLSREKARVLFDAIKWHLTDLEGKVVWAIHAEGEPYEDIAAALGIDAKTVDNAAQRARKKLAKVLGDATCQVCAAALDFGKMCAVCAEEIEFAKQFVAA
jgi:RNA polymerase sporulation-specific sigma factor